MSSERAALPWANNVRRPVIDLDTIVHVSRDPCPMCGIRGDLGCKHNRRDDQL